MSRELHGVMGPFLIGHLAQERVPQQVRGDVEVLVWGQMGVRLLGDAL